MNRPGNPECLYLIGDIAVVAVVVDHPASAFDTRQLELVAQQIERSLDYFRVAEPLAKLRFHTDVLAVQVDDNPLLDSKKGNTSAATPPVWLGAMLESLNAESLGELVRLQMGSKQCDQGFALVITNLPLAHFAYADGQHIFVHSGGGNYGPGMLYALIAHEICHVFGAADEYGVCHCGAEHGYLCAAHSNCYICNPAPEPCLMAGTGLELCASTRRQIGWDARLFPV